MRAVDSTRGIPNRWARCFRFSSSASTAGVESTGADVTEACDGDSIAVGSVVELGEGATAGFAVGFGAGEGLASTFQSTLVKEAI